MKVFPFRAFAVVLLACVISLAPWPAPASESGEVNVYSYRKPQLIDPMFEVFTEQTGIKVNSVPGPIGGTRKAVVDAVVRGLLEARLPPDRIIIWDQSLASLRAAGYDGLAKRRPLVATVLVVSFLSLVGIPPTVGFLGKLALFMTTVDGGYTWLAVVTAANTVASLFYYARVMGRAYFNAPPEEIAVLDRSSGVAVLIGGIFVIGGAVLAGSAFTAFQLSQLLPG